MTDHPKTHNSGHKTGKKNSRPVELKTLVDYFNDAEDATHDARLKSELCRDYYDGKQWSDKELAKLRKRNQPPIVFNMIQPKVDFLLGYEKQTRTDPKAFPRTPDHDEAANAATDGIRFVLDKEEFDGKASQQFEYMCIEGTGGVSVEVEEAGNDIDVRLRKLAWNRLFIDPHSMDRDCLDARYIGYISWKDADTVKQRWPHAAKAVVAGLETQHNLGDTKDDKPTRWYSSHRQRVMCVDINFLHNGIWHQAIFIDGSWLEKPKKSAYVDGDGVPQNKFLVASAKVDRDGQRYGPVKNDLNKQDEVNKRRSKALHLLNTRQTFAREGALGDKVDTFKKEANKPDGHLTYPGAGEFGKDFGIIPNEALAGPQFNMYLEAKASMDMSGANAALQGTIERGMSGRAIQTLQQGGLLELAPLFDTHSAWKKRVYRAIWDRIKQFWKEEKWVRVTDNEENLQWVGLNVPMTIGEQTVMQQTSMKLSEVREAFAQELEELHRQFPEMTEPAIDNAVAEIDVDIIIEEVPDVVNLQSEQFDQLVLMYQANPQSAENPNGIKWEDVIQVSTLRNKDRILGKDLTPEEKQANAQQQELQEEARLLTQLGITSEIESRQAKTQEIIVNTEAQQLETAITMDEYPNVKFDKTLDTKKKAGDAEQSVEKAFQTRVETDLLLTSPPPDKVAII